MSQRSQRVRQVAVVSVGVAVAGFVVLLLVLYRLRPSVGSFFLLGGWGALIAAGYYLVRAARTFDLTVAAGGLVDGDLTSIRRAELEREKKLLLKAIKEAEFDRDMGKLDQTDAAAVIGNYRRRAVEILKLLDDDATRRYEERVESELARRLGKLGLAPDPTADDADAGPARASAPSDGQGDGAGVTVAAPGVAGRTCASCATANDADARFCKGCGGKLEVAS